MRPIPAMALLLALAVTTTACSGGEAASKPPSWHNSQINAVSKVSTGNGVSAVTALRGDGTLETVALDVSNGKRLWAYPATMSGRLAGMGVQPPALISAQGGRAVVLALDPTRQGKWPASLIARDSRTGEQLWTRPMHSTFGPQRCGGYVCLSEHTSLKGARFVVIDPVTGKDVWRVPGIAEVEWSDSSRVVIFRLAKHPVLESHGLADGNLAWQLPVEQAVGPGVNLSGGWAFGPAGENLVGYLAPFIDPQKRRTSAFGFFSVRLSDGTVNWMRPSLVRVYPSGSPGVALLARPVDQSGQYGGFAHLDAVSGRVVGQIAANQVPGSGWWLAFPRDLSKLGFLKHSGGGAVFDLRRGTPADARGQRGWSFCVTDPKPLTLTGQQGFFPVAALCEFDLATGKRMAGTSAPPAWYTGSTDGWRLWRDEKGALHGVRDGTGTSPGMY